MAKVIALCGKICSGKTHHAKELCRQLPAVSLSCDELTLELFDGSLGEKHDAMAARIQALMLRKAVEIVRAGANVVLDSGFWKRTDREEAVRFFREADVELEWHYLDVGDETWKRNIAARNEAVLRGDERSYFVDEGLLQKCLSLFEAPSRDENFSTYP